MTILRGEHYVVESIHQLLNRTDFTAHDVLEAVENSPEFDHDDFAREANEIHEGEERWEHVESVHDLPQSEADEFVGAYNLTVPQVFIALLEQDDREWIHLFDGHVHDVVEVYEHKRVFVDREDLNRVYTFLREDPALNHAGEELRGAVQTVADAIGSNDEWTFDRDN